MKTLSENPAREVTQLFKKLSKQPIGDDSELGDAHRELNQLRRWEKNFRADASADNYALFRNHLRKLGLPEKPKLMLEATISVMQAIWVYANADGQPLGWFLAMQQYDPSKTPNASYVLTFELNGKAYARVLADSKLVLPDLADLYGQPFGDFKTVGFNNVSISHPDWSPFTKKELDEVEEEVTDDLRFDYAEDELDFWFDPRDDDTYLYLCVYDHEEYEEDE